MAIEVIDQKQSAFLGGDTHCITSSCL